MTELPSVFKQQLTSKLELVERGVAQFTDGLRHEVAAESDYVRIPIEAYISLLERGGKRWRGILTVTGFELYEGEDQEIIAKASGAIEGLHAYLLVLDDCADGDRVRRGGPAAHISISNYLKEQEAWGDVAAGGMHMAITAGTIAQYWTLHIMHELESPNDRTRLAQSLLYREFRKTGVGQLLDLAGSYLPLKKADIVTAAQYKTARYSFLLPLQVGAVLAGASVEQLDTLAPYAHNVGLAFQLRDDIIGLFGNIADTGKSPDRDIVTNKQTLLIAATLERANNAQRKKLLSALGNVALQDAEFQDCLEIIRDTGALSNIEKSIDKLTKIALQSLDNAPTQWPPQQVSFLHTLALYAAQRQK